MTTRIEPGHVEALTAALREIPYEHRMPGASQEEQQALARAQLLRRFGA